VSSKVTRERDAQPSFAGRGQDAQRDHAVGGEDGGGRFGESQQLRGEGGRVLAVEGALAQIPVGVVDPGIAQGGAVTLDPL
jgi:hypothetical protein